MRATEFEFRNRFWMMGLIFAIGFFCYSFDPVNVAAALLGMKMPIASTPMSVTIGGLQILFPSLMQAALGSAAGWKLRLIFAIATLVIAASAMIRTWATAYLRTDVVQDPKLRTETVVADGPYRYVRNPLYFSNVLMAVSMATLASRIGWFVIVIAMTVFQYRLIGREEQELLQTQGDRYRAYLKAVPRLLPSLVPRVPSSGRKPRWKQAWLAEAFFFWGYTTAFAVFAVTLNMFYFFVIFAISMSLLIFGDPLWKRLSG